jgi:hypothetical protein
MKWTALIAIGSLVLGTLLMRGYMTVWWHYFDMPYPDVIAPAFHLDGEAAKMQSTARYGWSSSGPPRLFWLVRA